MISVVIPAYNEEQGIATTIEHLQGVFKSASLGKTEIVVVDDCSQDETAQRAEALGATVIKHLNNFGYGRALKTGIAAAKHDTVVIVDADGTYPADDLPKLLEEYKKGFDMVVGARTGAHYSESWFKRPLRRLLKFLVEFSAGCRIPDVNSGMRIFSRDAVQGYFKQLSNSFSFTTSVTLAYLMTGRSISYVPIGYNKRIGKTKVRLFRDSLRTMQYIVQAILYYNPIKIFLVFDGVLLAIAAMLLLVALCTKLLSAFILGIGFILVAIIVFSIGLLADLLRQILIK